MGGQLIHLSAVIENVGDKYMNSERAIDLLRSLIPMLDSLKGNYGEESDRIAFQDKAETYIHTIFPYDENAQTRYANKLHTIHWYSMVSIAGRGTTQSDIKIWNEAVESATSLVNSMIEYVQLRDEQGEFGNNDPSETSKGKSNRVFIVHGHDESMQQKVALFLYKLKLEPIILSDEANGGFQSVMEKFETNAGEAEFAIVLLSPDDVGYAKRDGQSSAKSRARQNVILELGYFIGKLGRSNVMAFTKSDENKQPIEQPSDIVGGVIENFDDNWQERIRKELTKAGYILS